MTSRGCAGSGIPNIESCIGIIRLRGLSNHLFPQEFLGQQLELEEPEAEEILVSNIGNITFIHKDINSEIEDSAPESYMGTYVEAAKRHFVPTEQNLWSVGQYETFLSYRVRQMYAAGRKFFPEIFA